MFSELKFEFAQTSNENASFSTDPTVKVLDAFTSGGAGQSGVRAGRQFILDGSFDFTIRKHALRTGLLFEAGCGTARSRPTATAPTRSRTWPTSRPAWPRRSRAAPATRW